jgi:predicted DNA-binding transcriptional regulator AlpA
MSAAHLAGTRRFVRYADLEPTFGITYSRVHIGRLERGGFFPQRVRIGGNAIGWFEHEIQAWMESRERGPLPVRKDA